ncbi:hypothetical protein [Liquorilactobacillus sicerae]|uniref:hypothetical protein n=1 Tax=Liquorilactobacillus sicerae TaxID=1416943 RepID=UPI002481485B|nr:hypothetical protein [Liquorilactobacillus sicerae]
MEDFILKSVKLPNRQQTEGVISARDSIAKILVVPTNEELSMVQQIKKIKD